MYRPNGQSTYPPNGPYQQLPSHQTPRSYQQQQFGPRFQTPPQQFTPPRTFYPPPQLNQDHPRPPYQNPVPPQLNQDHPRPPYQGPVPPQPFYQPTNPNFDQTLKSPMQSLDTLPNPSYQPPIQNFNTPPNTRYPPPSPGSRCSQPPIPPYKPPGQTFELTIPNLSQPPPIHNYNQSVQNYNNHVPVQNYNQPPPVQNYNQSITPPYQPVNQNCHQSMGSPYHSPSPGYGSTLNSPYQPHVNSSESLKQPYQLSADQCYKPPQPSFNLPRNEFNQRLPFRPQIFESQRFAFNNQNTRYQQPHHINNRLQFHPRQQFQNYRPRGPSVGFNQSMGNNAFKTQIACEMGDCDFVGHASAVKEHQNLHHRLGLHKKVLYSNNSDAIKNWIEERKKKWPTKENIQIKLEVEDEKNKRGERIADEDFQRFNNKKNKFNKSDTRRFNNRKRPRFNGEFVEPVEEPMNGKLKRFSGIIEIKEKNENLSITIKDEILDESIKPVALKMLEEYEETSNQSDDEPPEEMAIVKVSTLPDDSNSIKPNEESIIKLEDTIIKNSEEMDTASLVNNDDKTVRVDIKIDSCSKVNEVCEKIVPGNNSQKRKKDSKKEFKPIKKQPPPRTPRTEVVERKGALLEALIGDLMRSERNTITQCICYIRNNMHRFSKIQAA